MHIAVVGLVSRLAVQALVREYARAYDSLSPGPLVYWPAHNGASIESRKLRTASTCRFDNRFSSSANDAPYIVAYRNGPFSRLTIGWVPAAAMPHPGCPFWTESPPAFASKCCGPVSPPKIFQAPEGRSGAKSNSAWDRIQPRWPNCRPRRAIIFLRQSVS